MMPTALPVASVHLLAEDDQIKVQNDFSDHVTSLALVSVSHNANSIINGPTKVVSSVNQTNQNEVQHDFFGNVTPLAHLVVSCDADDIISGIITFVRSGQSK